MANRKENVRRNGRPREEASGRRSEKGSRTSHKSQQKIAKTSPGDSPGENIPTRVGPGKIIAVASPIGNLGDLSPRTIKALSNADCWVVEDTRISAKLAFHLGLRKPMKVVNDHTQDAMIERILEEVISGSTLAVLSDGGAPCVSDPGSRLIDLAHEKEIEIDAIPGPSAVINALMLSGFFAQRFAFLGFLGRTPGDIRKELMPFADSPYTLVLFENQHRFRKLLETSAEVLGNRRYAICREITKANQQVFRSQLPTIPSEEEVLAKGEFTIVIEGRRKSKDKLQPWAELEDISLDPAQD